MYTKPYIEEEEIDIEDIMIASEPKEIEEDTYY